MKISEVRDEKIWEDFVCNFRPNNFLTSWTWADFNQKMGDKTLRLGVWRGSELVGVCTVIKVTAKRGSFLLCPAGPMFKNFDRRNFDPFVKYLKQIAEKEKAHFIRVRPLEPSGKVEKIIEEQNFKPSPTHVHSQVSWILDISKPEEELLSNMRKTTRYLVRHGAKEGLKVIEKNDLSGVRILEKLQEETVRRHAFSPFTSEYLEKEFETFHKKHQIKILIVYKGGQALAAGMIVFYGDSAFYHQGASVKTKLPATYLLQWEAIKLARKLGKKYYNFWGIAPKDLPSHPWYGLTYFKKGFGGFRIEYTKPHDFPLSLFYPIIYWFEKARNLRRGLG